MGIDKTAITRILINNSNPIILYANAITGDHFFLILNATGIASIPLHTSKLVPSKLICTGKRFNSTARHNNNSTSILNACMAINQCGGMFFINSLPLFENAMISSTTVGNTITNRGLGGIFEKSAKNPINANVPVMVIHARNAAIV